MDIEQAGKEALARINTHINNVYWNARMEVKSEFIKGHAFLRTLFVPENYGIEVAEEMKDPNASITFPASFAGFIEEKNAH